MHKHTLLLNILSCTDCLNSLELIEAENLNAVSARGKRD